MGIAVNGALPCFEQQRELTYLSLIDLDGSEYIIRSWEDDIISSAYACSYGGQSDGNRPYRHVCLFNRLVDPERVAAIVINGQVYPVKP